MSASCNVKSVFSELMCVEAVTLTDLTFNCKFNLNANVFLNVT